MNTKEHKFTQPRTPTRTRSGCPTTDRPPVLRTRYRCFTSEGRDQLLWQPASLRTDDRVPRFGYTTFVIDAFAGLSTSGWEAVAGRARLLVA